MKTPGLDSPRDVHQRTVFNTFVQLSDSLLLKNAHPTFFCLSRYLNFAWQLYSFQQDHFLATTSMRPLYRYLFTSHCKNNCQPIDCFCLTIGLLRLCLPLIIPKVTNLWRLLFLICLVCFDCLSFSWERVHRVLTRVSTTVLQHLRPSGLTFLQLDHSFTTHCSD